MVRRALVTGATGGLGRALVPALIAQGYAVRASGRDIGKASGLAALGAEIALSDLRTADLARLTAGCDAVFHLAALSSPWGRQEDFEAVNHTLTARLLDAASSTGCDAFIFVSTPSIFAEPFDRLGLRNDAAPARCFANAYAASKYAAERLVLEATRARFPTVVIRPRALVGAHDSVLLPRLIRAGRSGFFPLPRGGRALIDITDMRDAAAALIAADQRRHAVGGRALNVSGGAPRPLRQLIDLVFSSLGRSITALPVPGGAAMAAARVMESIARLIPGMPEPPATRFSVMALSYSMTFNLDETRNSLEWNPAITPEDAIGHALQPGNVSCGS